MRLFSPFWNMCAIDDKFRNPDLVVYFFQCTKKNYSFNGNQTHTSTAPEPINPR